MNKKHILHVTGAMNMGGAEVMLMDMYRTISKNFKFDFLVNYTTKTGIVQGDFDDEIRAKGGGIEHIGAQWDIGPLKYAKEFKTIYEKLGKPQIVHIHMNAKSGIIAWSAKRAGAKKIIVHSHADLKIRGSRIKVVLSKLELKFQQWLMAKYATDFWGCSQEANESLFYSRLLTSERSAIIKNAVDTKKFQNPNLDELNLLNKQIRTSEKTLVLGNIGRIVRHKNIGFVVDLIAKLAEEQIDAKFVFAGRADDQAYFDEIVLRAKELNIESRIIHLGPRKDIETVLHAFDVFVGPALREGFGLVAVEAQAASLPCVLYHGFPSSVDMELGLVTILDDFNSEKWTDAINSTNEIVKPSQQEILEGIITKGFDAQANTRLIEQKYLE